jgi:hypothetical protein
VSTDRGRTGKQKELKGCIFMYLFLEGNGRTVMAEIKVKLIDKLSSGKRESRGNIAVCPEA